MNIEELFNVIEERIKNTMDQEKVDKESAIKIIEHADKAQLKYFSDGNKNMPFSLAVSTVSL